MIAKREASDKHFFLSEKIKEVRPKRNNEGDIDKCIAYCEEGMNNLVAFIKEDYDNARQNHLYLQEIGAKREFISPTPPPSILCRDVLIDCYLMTNQFDLAKSVVKRTLIAGAWNEELSTEQIAFIENVRNAHILLFDRLKEFPGTLQKDVYAIVSNVDKKAMQWYLANSKTIFKVKLKSTYSLWLDKKDVPDEDFKASFEIENSNKETQQEIIAETKEIMLKNDLSVRFPNWYVSISFGRSTSPNYEKAVMIAKGATQYIETTNNDNIIHQAVYSDEPKKYLDFVALYELIQSWKSSFVIINNEIIDRKIIGGLNYCYGDKIRSGNPDFCFGASYMTENPFGCHRLQISQSNNPWWSFGKFNDNGDWMIDKDEILNRIKEYSIPYIHCPAFSMEKILERLDDLPDFINPKRNHEWIRTSNGVEPKVLQTENAITLKVNVSRNEQQGLLSSILKFFGFKKQS